MCKILGLSFKESTQRYSTQYYLRNFFEIFGPTNPHGWGFSFYDTADRAVLFKEAIPAQQSSMLKFLMESRSIQTQNVVAHVRLRSVGPIIQELAQPFVDGNLALAHNGTLYRLPQRLASDMSDSLYMFQQMKYVRYTPYDITNFLRKMNNYGGMSVIVSNGKFLIAYRDCGGAWPLHYRKGKPGYIISSMPFVSKTRWKMVPPGHSIVFEEGEMIDIIKGDATQATSTIINNSRAISGRFW